MGLDAAVVQAIARNHGSIQVVNIQNQEKEHLILKACNEIWEKAGLDVWGFSPSRRGAERLRDDTGIRSRCFRAFEAMRHPSVQYQVKHHIKQLVRQALFNRSHRLKSFKTKNKVIVVNDAHRLDLDQMHDLLIAIRKTEGRLVLVGSVDFREDRYTPLDHVAHRMSRNDSLQTRTDYIVHNPFDPPSQEQERNWQ